jgi:hypothetical protein
MKNMYILFSLVFAVLFECGPNKPAINYEFGGHVLQHYVSKRNGHYELYF